MKRTTLLVIPVMLAAGLGIYQFNNQPENTPTGGMDTDSQPAVEKPVIDQPVNARKSVIQKNRPNFAKITDVKTKKSTFFEYMLPMIRGANDVIVDERAIIVAMHAKLLESQPLTVTDQTTLAPILKKYRIDIDNELTVDHIDQLLLRCDIVPAALILAQSANESAWGTSRFAIKANNFFGLWCFSKGCGLTPLQRNEGATHEVAKFDTVNLGVRSYVRTINTNNAYKQLRAIRAALRKDNESITGTILAEGLLKYSERGEAYVEEIQSMIRFNKLQLYTLDTQS
jgi:Bax protein